MDSTTLIWMFRLFMLFAMWCNELAYGRWCNKHPGFSLFSVIYDVWLYCYIFEMCILANYSGTSTECRDFGPLWVLVSTLLDIFYLKKKSIIIWQAIIVLLGQFVCVSVGFFFFKGATMCDKEKQQATSFTLSGLCTHAPCGCFLLECQQATYPTVELNSTPHQPCMASWLEDACPRSIRGQLIA